MASERGALELGEFRCVLVRMVEGGIEEEGMDGSSRKGRDAEPRAWHRPHSTSTSVRREDWALRT